jgi:predicted LPLAT superfamily acyltransferase
MANLPRQEAMQAMLADFASAMEEKAKQYPEQWFNYYNFWQA